MKLRTEIENMPSQQRIGCRDGIVVFGSCFAENIGSWLKDMCLDVCCNPFGVLYNPSSIAKSIQGLLDEKRFTSEEMVKAPDGLYYSFAHHGKLYATSAEELVDTLNKEQANAEEALSKAKHLLITFGTSWVYEKDGEVVANCHKFPSNVFTRRMLSVEEIVELFETLIDTFPDKHIIFTVSPIRHVKDTLHGNQLSKSTLLLAIDKLCRLYPSQVEYLPIYELLIDDLRDYRFYAEDLVHPSDLAIEFVKEYFAENCLDAECKEFIKEVLPLVKSSQHRPLHPESDSYAAFKCQNNLKIDQLEKKYLIFGLEKLRLR